jgi:hypothetical protein
VGAVSAAQLLPSLRDLYSRLPETYHLQPWELQHVLFSLGYTDDLAERGGDRRGRRGGAHGLAAMEAGGMTHLMYKPRRCGSLAVHKTPQKGADLWT